MKSTLFSIFVLATSVCVSCGAGRKGSPTDDGVGVLAPIDENGLVTIDVAADYPREEIHLQDIADVEYVPLAISKEVLLKPSDKIFYLSDRHIMVYGNYDIFVFNRAGEIVSHFNRKGRGQGEYSMIRDAVFDEQAEEFFVFDAWLLSPKILVYSLEGKFKRILPLAKGQEISMYNFDGRSLLIYDNSGISESGGKFSTTPYRLISKADGSVIETLDIELPERYSNTITSMTRVGNEFVSQIAMISLPNDRLGGKNFTLADLSSDTIYNFTRERLLTPAFVRTPSVHASEPRTVWSTEVVAKNFIVFNITTLDFENGGAATSLMYDYRTGQVKRIRFVDDNNPLRWGELPADDTERPANTMVNMLNHIRLKEAHEKGELGGQLAELASKIREDDNPVVMIVKFR